MKQIISKLLFIVFPSLLVFFSFDCFSQTKQAIQSQKELREKDTLPKVNYKAMFDRAEAFMLDDNFEKALPLYDSLVMQNYKNGSWNFKLGLCYLHSATEYSKAVTYLVD